MTAAIIFLALFVFGWFLLGRANELCAIRVRSGQARLVRGRAPARFLSDVSEILRHSRVPDTMIRVVSERGTPCLQVSADVSDGVAQRLRNVTGEHRIVHFRTGKRPAR